MPARPSYAGPASKRARSSSTRRANSTVSNRRRPMVVSRIPRPLSFGRTAFPLRLANTIRYSEVITMATDVNGKASHAFGCNSLYDPNVGGTGHQPLYFDQLSAIYDHYLAMKSRIKLTLMTTDNLTENSIYTITIDDDASPATSAAAIREAVSSRSKVINPKGFIPTLRHSWDAQRTFGGNVQDNTALQGTNGANPTERSFFIISITGPALANYSLLVDVEYDTIWTELSSQSSS